MKKLIIIASAFFLPLSAMHAAFSLTGTSLGTTATGLTAGDVGVWIVNIDTSGFGTLSITEGFSITDSASYGSSYSVFTGVNTNTVLDLGSGPFLSSGVDTALGVNGISTGDPFAVIVFENSTTTAIAGDTFRIYAPGSTVGADGFFSYGTGGSEDYTTFSGAPTFTRTVTAIPEPSAFLLTGLGGLMLLRRRRNDGSGIF